MAADVWNSKPYTDWSTKDLQKITTDSPWAKKTTVLGMDGPAPPPMGGSGGGGGRGGRGGGGGGGDDAAPDPISSHGPASGTGTPVGGSSSPQVVVSWPMSAPLKQAAAKAKYGNEVATSPEAKQFLEREEPYYVIEVSQFPFRGRATDDFQRGAHEERGAECERERFHSRHGGSSKPPRQNAGSLFYFSRGNACSRWKIPKSTSAPKPAKCPSSSASS